MRYLDANVFVFAAASSEPEGHEARRILEETVSGKHPAATCSLSIDEITWGLRRAVDRKKAIQQATRVLALPNLVMLDVRARHMVSALDLMERYDSLDPRDALHAAVAIDAGIFTIVSDDADFDAVREITRTPLKPA